MLQVTVCSACSLLNTLFMYLFLYSVFSSPVDIMTAESQVTNQQWGHRCCFDSGKLGIKS